jgi:RHS repeat-associated protein
MKLYSRLSPIIFCLLLVSGIGKAQNAPKAVIPIAVAPQTIPSAYNNPVINFVRTWEPYMNSTDTSAIKSNTRLPSEVKQTTTYYDGLGREIQKVTKAVSPSGKDVVQPVLYDPFGREQYRYLPYVPKSGNTNDGNFKIDPFNAQSSFYKDTLLNPGVAGEAIFYARLEYENSPLNRPQAAYSPGNSWAKEGGNRPVRTQFLVNTDADSVRLFTLTDSQIIPTSNSFYPAGRLFKEVTINEAGNQIVEFKNKDGKIVLKKVQIADQPGNGHMGWLCTYSVYNYRNQLAIVITPKAVDAIKGSWGITATVAQNLCYIYRYDKRGRVIIQKSPGADSSELVYDRRDRLVIRRDGLLKNWGMVEVTYYDSFNRITMSGIAYDGRLPRQAMQDYLDTTTNTTQLPFINPAATLPQVYTYYDDYSYAGKINYNSTDIGKVQAGWNPYAEALPGSPSTMTKGLITGKKVYVMATGQWLMTSIYYNDKGRVIQTDAQNYAGGMDIVNTLYDFSGKILSTYQRHNNPKSPLTPQSTLLTMYHYDAAGRPDSLKKRLNDDPTLEQTISLSSYDELGQQKRKRLNASGSNQLETLDYSYNIRGWIKGINKDYVNTINSTSNYFGTDICYENGFDSTEFTGASSGVKWKTKSDGLARAFGFDYDRSGRLISADYNQQNSGVTTWTKDKLDYSLSGLTYDLDGNILSMKQRGMNGIVKQTLDSLKYGYNSLSDQLNFVTDKTNNPSSLLGDFKEVTNNESQDYTYDANGNVTKDKNKDIDTIQYDANNLPAHIVVKGRGSIDFVYDGEGHKLAKVITDTSNTYKTVITTYTGGFVYKDSVLQYVATEEGRIRANYKASQPVRFIYDYFVKDQLGNTRVVLATNSDTAIYVATMETAASTVENQLFKNIDATRTARPSGSPTDNTTSPNSYVSKTNANTSKIGPSIVTRVMSGDTLNLGAKAFYLLSGGNTSIVSPDGIISSLLPILNTSTISDGVHQATGPGSPINSVFTGSLYTLVKNQNPGQNLTTQPQAYLNYVLFDDQFNMVSSCSGVLQVQGSANTLITLSTGDLVVPKTGFIYIYASNESATDVYFDNLIINHRSGPLLEETHYYPFGLPMAGLSCKALKGAGYPLNKLLLTGKELQDEEFNDGWDLDWFDFGARMYDPQIGRFHVQDPHAYRYAGISPYSYACNNPVSNIDPTGKDARVTGTGSQKDPYVVSANYYYYGMSAEQVAGLQAAIAEYNNGGNATVVNIDGKDVYVKFNLTATEKADRNEALSATDGDWFEGSDGQQHNSGNVVTTTTTPANHSNEMGDADNKNINLHGPETKNAIENGMVSASGAQSNVRIDYVQLFKSTFVHEIAHNLTGIHTDMGAMQAGPFVRIVEYNDGHRNVTVEFGGCLTSENIKAMIMRIDKPYGTDYEQDIDFMRACDRNPNTDPRQFGTSGSIYQKAKDQ